MKRLIVNADGFGFTFGNNRAILEVLEHGFIRSVSVNVTFEAVKEVPVLARDFPHVSIGIHLNLSNGPSLLPPGEIPSLIGAGGLFHGDDFPRMATRGNLNRDEMKREIRAQIRRLRDYGVAVTHWESHKGRHLYPGFFEAAMETTKQEGIPATRTHEFHLVLPRGWRPLRVLAYYVQHPRFAVTHSLAAHRMRILRRAGFQMPDRRLVMDAMGPDACCRPECWQLMLETMLDGLNVIECHPGYVDDELRKYAKLLEQRERERDLFADPHWAQRARDAGVAPVSYHALLNGEAAQGR